MPVRARAPVPVAAWVLLGLGVVFLVGGAAFPYWACHLAAWNCPANGCGNVPQTYCTASVELGGALASFAVALLAGGVLVILLDRQRRLRGDARPELA